MVHFFLVRFRLLDRSSLRPGFWSGGTCNPAGIWFWGQAVRGHLLQFFGRTDSWGIALHKPCLDGPWLITTLSRLLCGVYWLILSACPSRSRLYSGLSKHDLFSLLGLMMTTRSPVRVQPYSLHRCCVWDVPCGAIDL